MNKTAWEIIIHRCPHCKERLGIHHRSTISERHLMEMIFKDINFHLNNECNDSNPKSVKVEMETESISNNSAIKLYKTEDLKLIF
jgi:hypothetical protein